MESKAAKHLREKFLPMFRIDQFRSFAVRGSGGGLASSAPDGGCGDHGFESRSGRIKLVFLFCFF